MKIDYEIKLDFNDVLLRPKRSTLGSRKEVVLEREYTFRNSKGVFSGIPIMASNMDTTGTLLVAEVFQQHKMFTCLHKQVDPAVFQNSLLSHYLCSVSSGITESDLTTLYSILNTSPTLQFICLDVANGYSERFASVVKQVREDFPNKTIIAGNVVTADMTQELILAGADIIKVGLGSGSVCLTRKKTGVGYPQLSAIIECADAAHGLGGHVISDGGCTCPGDVAKAFAAGADFVMMGGMLAGHNETGTEFYGMSSKTAQDKHADGLKNYRASEGRTVTLANKGPLDNLVKDVLGGLRSSCTYIGAKSLKDMSKCATFIRVNNQLNMVFETKTIGE